MFCKMLGPESRFSDKQEGKSYQWLLYFIILPQSYKWIPAEACLYYRNHRLNS